VYGRYLQRVAGSVLQGSDNSMESLAPLTVSMHFLGKALKVMSRKKRVKAFVAAFRKCRGGVLMGDEEEQED
jgi:hypothetical protein